MTANQQARLLFISNGVSSNEKTNRLSVKCGKFTGHQHLSIFISKPFMVI